MPAGGDEEGEGPGAKGTRSGRGGRRRTLLSPLLPGPGPVSKSVPSILCVSARALPACPPRGHGAGGSPTPLSLMPSSALPAGLSSCSRGYIRVGDMASQLQFSGLSWVAWNQPVVGEFTPWKLANPKTQGFFKKKTWESWLTSTPHIHPKIACLAPSPPHPPECNLSPSLTGTAVL